MSLIVTHISKYGIIHMSDSNLTSNGSRPAGQGQKTFSVNRLNAGLTIAGAYSVGRTNMDVWMNDFIEAHAVKNISLKEFSESLRRSLEVNMLDEEKRMGCFIHICGYVQSDRDKIPEFWFIRNVHGINRETGEYEGIDGNFEISEDLYSKFNSTTTINEFFGKGNDYLFSNGFAPGRIALFSLMPTINQFISGLWKNPSWRFREPRSVKDYEVIIRGYFNIVSMLFTVSDYSAPYIGGEIRSHIIPYAV
jgi:hypothetical protein